MSTWRDGLIAPASDDLAKCVACGLCLPHCPTFRVTGLETASPRGRIAAMRAVDEGRAEMDAEFRTMMDECLACRACEAACPSGVPYGRLIEGARAQIEPDRAASVRGAKRVGVGWVLSRPRLVRLLGAGLAIAQATRLDLLVPRRLRAASPRIRLRELLSPLPAPIGAGPTAAILTGCVMDAAYRPTNAATARAAAAAGYRAEPMPGCCGALAMHNGLPGVARTLARERIVDMSGAEVVVVNSSGCSAHMKNYGELLADEAEWSERAESLAAKVVDLVELPIPASLPQRPGEMAVHDACHHLHAQGIGPQLRAIVRGCGGTPVELRDPGRCCGAAGLYALLEPELSAELGRQKAAAIAATGARSVVVANPGCAIQIERWLAEVGADVEVVHPAHLIA